MVIATSLPLPTVPFVIHDEEDGMRLDRVLREHCWDISLANIHRALREGDIKINGVRAHAHNRVQTNDTLRLPPLLRAHWHHEPTSSERRSANTAHHPTPPSATKLSLIYEDESLLIVDKPAGLACHGGSGVSVGLIEHLRQTHNLPSLELAHRLDRETSGVMALTKNRSSLRPLMAQFREGTVRKEYRAVVFGHFPKKRREINAPLYKYEDDNRVHKVIVSARGKPSLTRVEILGYATSPRPLSYLRLHPQTGRTHQLRVHLSHIGHPILGDERYADFAENRAAWSALRPLFSHAPADLARMYLHAHALHINHPRHAQSLSFTAPLPPEMATLLQCFALEAD